MAEKKFVDLPALSHFLDGIKNLFALKGEVPSPPGDPKLFYNGDGDWTEAGKLASSSESGFMSSDDKSKLDTITGGGADSVVLANGTVMSMEDFIDRNVEYIRTKLGVATTEHDGLMPKLPENPKVD